MMMRIVAMTVGVASLASALTIAQRPAPDMRSPKQDYNSGEYLYRAFCASCHGSRGSGDGVVASILRVAPSDLTSIARRSSGTFPRDQVFSAIDGRAKVAGHGSGEMPVWGDVLKKTEGQSETIIRKRIDALVAYVESLQSPP